MNFPLWENQAQKYHNSLHNPGILQKSQTDVKKAWLEENLKEIKNLINNQTLLMDDPDKVYPVTPCMDVCKEKSNMMEVLTS